MPPTTKATAKRTTTARRAAPTQRPARPDFVEPTAAPAAAPERYVDGQRVIAVRPRMSGLSNRPGSPAIKFKKIVVLDLEGGGQTFGCAEDDFAGPLGDVYKHRYQEHGDPHARTNRKPSDPPAAGGLSPSAMSMTLGEVVSLANAVDRWEDLLTQVTVERDEAVARADAAEKELKALKKQAGKFAALLGGEGH